MLVKKTFDTPLTHHELEQAHAIVTQSLEHKVTTIINVGTSVPESYNCLQLAERYPAVWAAIGLHPNDCTAQWRDDLKQLRVWAIQYKQNKLVAIGECGLDFHYPDYNMQRQKDAFKAQIELALEHNLALIIHTRNARDETARIMEEFKGDVTRGIVHCFSEDLTFAQFAIDLGYTLGIGATITYPKNEHLRTAVTQIPLESIVLETDAPFLPPQALRGKTNYPHYIPIIADYIAQLRNTSIDMIAQTTTQRAYKIFNII